MDTCTAQAATTISPKGAPPPVSPITLAVLAFGWWGLVPAYWKQLPKFSPEELIFFRILLSLVCFLPLLLLKNEVLRIRQLLSSKRSFIGLTITSILIGLNWYLYVWAINHNHVVESSLGYFLNPLVNMALGALLLKERMGAAQKIACAISAAGTLLLASKTGGIPWIALALASTFASYGLLRKILHLPTLAATACETAILSLPAAGIILWLGRAGQLHAPSASASELAWLAMAGLVSTLPLLAFAEAAKRLPLSSLGFLQFLSPTLQFLLGVFLYREPFGPAQWWAFSLVWLGLAIFLIDLKLRLSKEKLAATGA